MISNMRYSHTVLTRVRNSEILVKSFADGRLPMLLGPCPTQDGLRPMLKKFFDDDGNQGRAPKESGNFSSILPLRGGGGSPLS